MGEVKFFPQQHPIFPAKTKKPFGFWPILTAFLVVPLGQSASLEGIDPYLSKTKSQIAWFFCMREQETERTTREYLTRRLQEAALAIQSLLQLQSALVEILPVLPRELGERQEALRAKAKRFLNQSPPASPAPKPLVPTRVAVLAEELAETFGPVLERKGMFLSLKVDQEITLPYPQESLSCLLHLLLENAVRLTFGGAILLVAKLQDDKVLVEVADQGAGLDPKQLKRLELGLDPVPSDTYGLVLAKALAEEMGVGWVISSEPNQGTRVSLWFGTAPWPKLPPLPPLSAKEKPPGGPQPKVLVITQEERTLNLMKLYLQQRFDSLTASSGQMGLEWLEQEKVDLILVDLSMTGLDGLDVLAEVRENYGKRELPVIFLVHEEESPQFGRLLRLGGNDCLKKPVNPDELLAKLEFHLAQKTHFLELTQRGDNLEQQLSLREWQLSLLAKQVPLMGQVGLPLGAPVIGFSPNFLIQYLSPEALLLLDGSLLEALSQPLSQYLPLDWPWLFEQIGELGPKMGLVLFTAKEKRSLWLFRSENGGALAFGPERLELPEPPFVSAQVFRVKKRQKGKDSFGPLAYQLDFPKVGPKAVSPARVKMPELIAELMGACLALWERKTRADKVELADQSGLWIAAADKKGTYRTKTLDRYLDPHKVPKHPRVQTVLQTAYFVCQRFAKEEPKEVARIEALARRLEVSLGQKRP
ncbi:MAG: hypothetical protein A2600_00845 [Candidatus Lambdaproteobacteria bacterium RIFOXYD1_FULL_56_27]|uniref:Response regulatory domain-containing protein n=1 Tax=Candidatus Lambdaproteobacteria bacterium RIFOXYD2_FULL_56_26 TaxID=1817773 RepID=A0A1F6GLR5_9PROT|nr:MAG: hypothetical protein A2557_09675 [Candidatus Lambdaproteobacteria bacterium RIFOXYD2_FULL_56_26]OGH05678.1 MAG: hypothetical protein A2426_04055 [Candidatus Lambdaproteobacteria bacterium RIFOXYC1_FULL_56_13]OGH07100.1 MAG: hypothetical protein A2600_00845 [Candidatus Lambdaproteobacteria bacterium RIFOXYD1_FULL_56_27]